MSGRGGWRTGALAREAWLGIVAHPVRSGISVALVGLVCGGLALLELRDSRSALGAHRDFIAAGGTVVVVAAAEGAPIDAARCASLHHEPFVVAAGAIGNTELASFATAPGLLFQRASVTRGALSVWDPGVRLRDSELGGGFAAGRALADELGLKPGMAVVMVGGENAGLLTTTIDPARRNPQVGRWLLDVVAPSGMLDQCWVEFVPGAFEPGLAALAATFATGTGEPIVRQYRARDEFTRDPAAEFSGRPQRMGWVAGALLIAVVGWLMTWFRRSETGIYLALGTRRVSLLFMSAIEAWMLIGAGLMLGCAYAVAFEGALGHTPGWAATSIAARTAGLTAMLAIAATPIGHLLVRGDVLALLKDR